MLLAVSAGVLMGLSKVFTDGSGSDNGNGKGVVLMVAVVEEEGGDNDNACGGMGIDMGGRRKCDSDDGGGGDNPGILTCSESERGGLSTD